MEIDRYIQGAEAYVWEQRYAVVKARHGFDDAFAVVVDKDETTVVIEEESVDSVDVIEVETGWRIITFDMILPFGLVGFMARVSSSLAESKIGIFVISAFSTDHILVKENDLEKSVRVLEGLGIAVRR
jgi:hypothetical protein